MLIKIIRVKRPRRKNKNNKKTICYLMLVLLFLSLISFARIYNDSFKPVVKQMALYRAEQLSAEAISSGVVKVLSETEIRYDDIVETTKNPDGSLTSLSVNLFKINRLKSEVTLLINEIINSKSKIKIQIPLGNVIASAAGLDLFSGLGPMIPVEFVPGGSVFVDFDNKFTVSGINQTRHTVSLKITAKISMISPENITAASETVSYIPIAESIIVGNIPDTYTVLETSPECLREDALNLQ